MTEELTYYCEDCSVAEVTKNRRYCDQCLERRKSESHGKIKRAPKLGIQKCLDCDDKCESVQSHRCKKCKKIHRRNQAREHARRRLGRANPNRPCKWCDDEIDYATEGINVRQEYHVACLKKRDQFKAIAQRHKVSQRLRVKGDEVLRLAINELEDLIAEENLQVRVRRVHTLSKFLAEFNHSRLKKII